uniref:Uncharacterized protein n=1 Tax=Cacopsylla melanoneura TaxID=428564 RepID=A0A8D8QH87_9HEMI
MLACNLASLTRRWLRLARLAHGSCRVPKCRSLRPVAPMSQMRQLLTNPLLLLWRGGNGKRPSQPQQPALVRKPPSPRRGFVVRPGEGQTVEALRNELQKSINPSDHGVGIKRLITAKDGLRVEVNSEATTDTIKSLRDAVAAKQPEATTCDLHEHRLPRIVVYDVKLEVESNESFKETFCDQKFCRRRAQT